VTVLFADVVDSMHLAATLGAERLREIMTALVGVRGVVQRYGGTVDKFTGDRSWRCSGRRLHSRTTLSALAERRWTSRRDKRSRRN
jgi:class 3 adenylate cyclase